MSAFTEQALVRRLAELNQTEQSIQTLSLWLIHHRKRAALVCETWLRQLKRETANGKLLGLMYLCNDVLQNGRLKGPEYNMEFAKTLEPAFGQLARVLDEKSIEKMRRLLDVWHDRKVIGRDLLKQLEQAMIANLPKDKLSAFNAHHAPQSSPNISVHKQQQQAAAAFKPSPPKMPKYPKELENFGISRKDDSRAKSPKIPISTTPPRIDAPLEPIDPHDVPKAEEIIESIQKLENAASADAAARTAISALPEDCANIDALEDVTTKYQAEQLSQKVDLAYAMVSSYNDRLTEEMKLRRKMQSNLSLFICYQKQKINEEEKELADWHTKLEKLAKDRKDLQAHVESLPDISHFKPEALAPLPSVGELFTTK